MDTIDKRILLIGGTGFLGQPIAQALIDAGHPIRILARNPEKARNIFGENADIVQGDVTNPETLPAAMEGCYGVHISLHGQQGKANFFRVEHRGVENAAKTAVDAGVKQITMISGANVCRDETVYFVQAKFLGEEALLNGAVPAAIFRASWFMESLPLMIRGPMAVIVGKQPHPIHFIAIKDLARMIVTTYSAPEPHNRRFEAYGPEAITVHHALKKYCNIFAPRAIILHMPIPIFWVISRVAGGRLKFVHDLMKLLNNNPEPKDCGDSGRILGSNTINLNRWLDERKRQKDIGVQID